MKALEVTERGRSGRRLQIREGFAALDEGSDESHWASADYALNGRLVTREGLSAGMTSDCHDVGLRPDIDSPMGCYELSNYIYRQAMCICLQGSFPNVMLERDCRICE